MLFLRGGQNGLDGVVQGFDQPGAPEALPAAQGLDVHRIALSADGLRLAALTGGAGTPLAVRRWPVGGGEASDPLELLPHGVDGTPVAFDADAAASRAIAVFEAAGQRHVALVDLQGGAVVPLGEGRDTLSGDPVATVSDAAFLTGGRIFLASGQEEVVTELVPDNAPGLRLKAWHIWTGRPTPTVLSAGLGEGADEVLLLGGPGATALLDFGAPRDADSIEPVALAASFHDLVHDPAITVSLAPGPPGSHDVFAAVAAVGDGGAVLLWHGQRLGHPENDHPLWQDVITAAGPEAGLDDLPGAQVLVHEGGGLRLMALTGASEVLYWDGAPGQAPERFEVRGVVRDAVLRRIAPVEVCDGVDDDCDGDTDEGFGVGQGCDALGECPAGALQCTADGQGVVCDTRPGGDRFVEAEDRCDGLDNDCDGDTDEDDPRLGGDCVDDALGAECGAGVVACSADGELDCVQPPRVGEAVRVAGENRDVHVRYAGDRYHMVFGRHPSSIRHAILPEDDAAPQADVEVTGGTLLGATGGDDHVGMIYRSGDEVRFARVDERGRIVDASVSVFTPSAYLQFLVGATHGGGRSAASFLVGCTQDAPYCRIYVDPDLDEEGELPFVDSQDGALAVTADRVLLAGASVRVYNREDLTPIGDAHASEMEVTGAAPMGDGWLIVGRNGGTVYTRALDPDGVPADRRLLHEVRPHLRWIRGVVLGGQHDAFGAVWSTATANDEAFEVWFQPLGPDGLPLDDLPPLQMGSRDGDTWFNVARGRGDWALTMARGSNYVDAVRGRFHCPPTAADDPPPDE